MITAFQDMLSEVEVGVCGTYSPATVMSLVHLGISFCLQPGIRLLIAS